MKIRLPLYLAFSACILSMVSCGSTTPRDVPGSIIVSGRMNAVGGGKVLGKPSSCWALETTGGVHSMQFYQFIGNESLLSQIKNADLFVKVRILPRPDVAEPVCPVGIVAELIEVLETKK